MQVSTDYVFAGDARTPYAEHDPAAPRTAYGRTKLAGEQAVLRLLPEAGYVVRTAWLYGAHGAEFRRHDDPAGAASGPPSTSSTTSAASRPGRPTSPGRSSRLSASGGAGRHLPRDQLWRGDLVRPGPARCSACSAPTRPGCGRRRAARTPARSAARLQRARPRRLGPGRARAHRRLAARAAPGLSRADPRGRLRSVVKARVSRNIGTTHGAQVRTSHRTNDPAVAVGKPRAIWNSLATGPLPLAERFTMTTLTLYSDSAVLVTPTRLLFNGGRGP